MMTPMEADMLTRFSNLNRDMHVSGCNELEQSSSFPVYV